ncbi:hypothetical protein E4U22_000559 [Claviceps purpurea]|uniref:DASH complex subunit DAM1 n=2 Tax=Claviceps TaxID=5110 RepID=M1W2F8_CLAP2|nr:hypothetical protein E4U38_007860 [Claviceps purpurea]KAG6284616.1 hypothetical protein E4U09_007762 [Claviceps aff. purpurea]CCE27570.1 uncharacterized protein CPUR_01044 [Claviceps purpurea 20.1]KAG6125495.1 hypothetical protein E4U12_007260 [Claviceps purpurea]KAG6127714.1 hypothetical protein E4U28_008507 [Claviceps purpurea]
MQDFGGKHHDDIVRGGKRSRPTTPLRPSSISSFRDSARDAGKDAPSFPLNTFEPAFTELSDGLADLEANMMHFQLMHESLSRFSESFASFLYGLNMNAFCADFPEGPILESFGRSRGPEENSSSGPGVDFEATFMTTDTSFVDNPPTSTKTQPKSTAGASRQSRLPFVKGQSTTGTLIRRTRGGRSKLLGVRGRTAS